MFGFDAAHTHFNPYEKVLTSSNVSRLTQGWTYPSVGVISTAPAIADGIVYVGSVDKSLYALLWMHALAPSSGGLPLEIGVFASIISGGIIQSPAVVNGIIYLSYRGLVSLDYTGKKLKSFSTGGAIYSSPVVVNGVIYFGSEDHSFYALDADLAGSNGALLREILSRPHLR